jgi:hypothetical protein
MTCDPIKSPMKAAYNESLREQKSNQFRPRAILHQNQWRIIDRPTALPQTANMKQSSSDSSYAAASVARWRAKKVEQGQVTFRVQLPKTVKDQITSIQKSQKLGNLGDAFNLIIALANRQTLPSELQMPPVTPKTEAIRDITTIIAAEHLDYLNRVKTDLGLPRAKAIHAILHTFSNELEKANEAALQPNFNFNKEGHSIGK